MRSGDSSLRDLEPTLVLIGSAAEDTRLVEADEINVSLKFHTLSGHALKMDNDADALAVVASENAPVLSSYTFNNTRILDYSKFFGFLLTELCSSLKRIKDRLPQGLACNVDWVHTDCSGCQKSEALGLVSFCLDHLATSGTYQNWSVSHFYLDRQWKAQHPDCRPGAPLSLAN